jgi:hypothetical protein
MKKLNNLYGICRIDQPAKKNHGWYVRITLFGIITCKFFPDVSLGGKEKALKLAQTYRDALVAQLPPERQAKAALGRKGAAKKKAE